VGLQNRCDSILHTSAAAVQSNARLVDRANFEVVMSWYAFFQDQGSALGAVATFVAVLVALGIGHQQASVAKSAAEAQVEAAKSAAEAQVAAIREQMLQTERALGGDRQRRAKDLLQAISNEASRIKLLADDRLKVLKPKINSSTSLNRDDRAEAFLIRGGETLRNGAGISELPVSLLGPCSQLLKWVDHLNSMIQVRTPFGQLGWRDLEATLLEIVESADGVLTQTALAPDDA
jgi:hypothetical protein